MRDPLEVVGTVLVLSLAAIMLAVSFFMWKDTQAQIAVKREQFEVIGRTDWNNIWVIRCKEHGTTEQRKWLWKQDFKVGEIVWLPECKRSEAYFPFNGGRP